MPAPDPKFAARVVEHCSASVDVSVLAVKLLVVAHTVALLPVAILLDEVGSAVVENAEVRFAVVETVESVSVVVGPVVVAEPEALEFAVVEPGLVAFAALFYAAELHCSAWSEGRVQPGSLLGRW